MNVLSDTPEEVFGGDDPFGTTVVASLNNSELNETEQMRSAQAELRAIRYAARHLLASSDRGDQARVEEINARHKEDNLGNEYPVSIGRPSSSIMKWLARVPYDKLQSFCAWNLEQHAQHQQQLNAVLPELKDYSVDGIDKLVDTGFLSSKAGQHFKNTVSEVDYLQALDTFQAGWEMADGYWDDSSSKLAVANLFALPQLFSLVSPSMKWVVFHEFLHKAGGKERGLFYGIAKPLPPEQRFRLLEEVIVSHVTEVAVASKHPNPQTVDPAFRYRPSAKYSAERQFLGTLLMMGSQPPDIEMVVEAYFEPRNDMAVARKTVETRFKKAMTEFFPELGSTALRQLSNSYERTQKIDRPKLVRGWTDKILKQAGLEIEKELASETAVCRAAAVRP